MTKKDISTLVPDIYDVFLNHKTPSAEDVLTFGQEIMDSVVRQITEVRDRKQNLRLSQIGKGDRKIYYDLQEDVERETIDAPTRIKFLFGDIIESLVVLLIKTSGHTLTDEQKEVIVNGVVGHMDGKIDGVVSDIKSASPFGYKKFLDGTLAQKDDFGYIPQVSSYAEAEGDTEAAFVVMNKVTGELALTMVHHMEMINAGDRVTHLKDMVASEDTPDRCYPDVADGTSGNRVLHKNCGYCEYKEPCHQDINNGMGLRKFQYANGPRYFTLVVKQPQVQEIL